MLNMGKTLLLFEEIDPIQEIYERIDAVTAADITDIANEIFREENLSTLYYIPY